MKLTGKVAVITGGSRGIGRAMAELFVNEGANVIACSTKETNYENDRIEGYVLNVADSAACAKFFEYVVSKYGKIDILVNNAGITRDAMTRKLTDQMWDEVMDINLKGVFNLTRLIGPHMEDKGYGSIISISSVVGEYGNIGQANYAAAKAGIIGMTKTWAKEFARKGANVRVNCIAPGYVMTDILKTVSEELLEKFSKMTMLGRLGRPEEIAKAALFLACDDSSYVTGHTLSVNGGMRL